MTRDERGTLHAFENRCAHRGALLCLNQRGQDRKIVCVYHNWTYDLEGNLTGVAFRRGLGGQGGLPEDCRPETQPAQAARRNACWPRVRNSLAATPSLETYLGAEIIQRIRRVMRAPVKVLGSYSQIVPSNWKLYLENVKDTYHASLLHTFFTTFRLARMT